SPILARFPGTLRHHGAAPQGPPDRRRRVLPSPGGTGVAHARRRDPAVRGAAAESRGATRGRRVPAAPGPALPAEAGVPAVPGRPPGVDRRSELQPRVPRAAYRASEPGLNRAAARAGRAHLLAAPRSVQA